MKNFVKIFASILLIILGNALIFPLGFGLACTIAVWIPRLNEIYLFWLAEIIAAVPISVIFLFMRRLFDRVFKLDVRRTAAVLACALPSLVISVIVFFVMIKNELVRGGNDIDANVIVAFFAIPYTALCILVIAAGLIVLLPSGIIFGNRIIGSVDHSNFDRNSVAYQLSSGSVKGLERLLKKGAVAEGIVYSEERAAEDGELTWLSDLAYHGFSYPDSPAAL